MTHCQNCGSRLLKGAKFCHHCGETVVLKLEICSYCNSTNPAGVAFCHSCGENLQKTDNQQHTKEKQSKKSTHQSFSEDEFNRKKRNQPKKTPPYKAIYPVYFGLDTEIEEQIKTYFFKTLRQWVETLSSSEKYSDYVQIFYDSGFSFHFSNRQRQLVKDLNALSVKFTQSLDYQVDSLIEQTFEDLLMRFITLHTTELNAWQPPNVLKYENAKADQIYRKELILDYLDIDPNQEKIYTNFVLMPHEKLKAACRSFLFAKQHEVPVVIADQSIFGTGREGFAFTELGIYWKAFFNKPQQFSFEELQDVRQEEAWLTINGQYFHADNRMNFKILRLLKKLKHIFSKP